MARLKQFYFDTVVKELKKKFDYSSTMQVPRITKITLNMGVGEAVADKKVLDNALKDMEQIFLTFGMNCLFIRLDQQISF